MKNHSYSAQITRNTPAFIMFLLDLSSSMNEKIVYEGVLSTKAEFMNRIINITLSEILCYAKRIDGYRDYFNIGVYGYSDDSVYNVLNRCRKSKDFYTVSDLITSDIPDVIYESLRVKQDGGSYVSTLKIREYVRSSAYGNTPMGMAIDVAHTIASKWIGSKTGLDSFPPIIINISDGEATDVSDEELRIKTDRLKSLKTNDGSLLMFNIHIASAQNVNSLIFPSKLSEEQLSNRHTKLLFDVSSTLPSKFYDEVAMLRGESSIDCLNPPKAFAYNSSMNELLKMLNIGSISVIKH